jgi:hypothetical protein
MNEKEILAILISNMTLLPPYQGFLYVFLKEQRVLQICLINFISVQLATLPQALFNPAGKPILTDKKSLPESVSGRLLL